ncbi:MAG TPA: helix-turn-helix transcriptional regulator [Thermoanaerobaculia bacterium]|jgi:transcriptional regulator with XRE-family HTH domain
MLFNAWPEVLRAFRQARGPSQEAAAFSAGVTTTTWYRWENGIIHPNRSNFECIAAGLGCTPEELGSAYAKALADHYLPAAEDAGAESGEAAPASPTPDADRAALRQEELDAASLELNDVVTRTAALAHDLASGNGGPGRLGRMVEVLRHTRSAAVRTHTLLGVLEEISREAAADETVRRQPVTRARKGDEDAGG